MGPHGMLPSVAAYLSLAALLLGILIVVVFFALFVVDVIRQLKNMK